MIDTNAAEEEAGNAVGEQKAEDTIPQESRLPRESQDENRRLSVDEYYNTGNMPEDDMQVYIPEEEEQEDEEAKKKQFLEARKTHYKISKNILSNPVELHEEEGDFKDNSNEMMH